MDFDTIYYINLSTKPPRTPDGVDNGGYDNDKGEYICENKDHIQYRYEVKKQIGKGSFG